MKQKQPHRQKTFQTILKSTWLPAIVFVLAALILFAQSFRFTFHDEGDILTVGWLMTRGKILYRDIFSHHFPLPYFWSAGVTAVFGQSLIAQRLSIAILTVLVFWLGIRITQKPLAISLQFLLWAQFNHLVRGNMVLYHSFAALSVFLIFLIVFFQKKHKGQVPGWQVFLLGFASSTAMLASVIFAYPILIAFLFYAVNIFRQAAQGDRKQQWRELVKKLWPYGIGLFLLPLLFLIYLLVTKSVGNFWMDGIRFNLDYYGKYINANSMSPLQVLFYVVTLHHPFQVLMAAPLQDNWILNYIFFITLRLGVLFATLEMILTKRYGRAGFTFLFLAALLIRNNGANGQPYMIIALFVLVDQLSLPWLCGDRHQKTAEQTPTKWPKLRLGLKMGTTLIVAVIFFRLLINLGLNLDELTPTANFQALEEKSAQIRAIKSECPSLKMLAYPFDFYAYYVAEVEPASKYHFVLQWVDDYAADDIIEHLAAQEPILFTYERVIDYYEPTRILAYVNQHYDRLSEDWWASPALTNCLADPD
jgi:hypothetical protein